MGDISVALVGSELRRGCAERPSDRFGDLSNGGFWFIEAIKKRR
jgi:hypothetical protein